MSINKILISFILLCLFLGCKVREKRHAIDIHLNQYELKASKEIDFETIKECLPGVVSTPIQQINL
jgi:hypothetical protein